MFFQQRRASKITARHHRWHHPGGSQSSGVTSKRLDDWMMTGDPT